MKLCKVSQGCQIFKTLKLCKCVISVCIGMIINANSSVTELPIGSLKPLSKSFRLDTRRAWWNVIPSGYTRYLFICPGLKLCKPEMINTLCPDMNMHTNKPWHVFYQRLRFMFKLCWNKAVNEEEFCIFDFLHISQDILTKASKTWNCWLLSIWNISHWVSATWYLLQKTQDFPSDFRINKQEWWDTLQSVIQISIDWTSALNGLL